MKKIITLFSALALASVSAFADDISTSYFLDNNVYSYRINPAIAGDQNFVAVGFGNFNATVGSNIGVNSFIFKNPNGSGFVTGLNKAITSEEFLGKLKPYNSITENCDINILGIGFWVGKSFHSIEINTKENVSGVLPRDMFDMVKNGTRATPFDLSGTGVSGTAYSEIAYGYSRKIGDKLSIGARAKFLIGLFRAEAAFGQSSITMNESKVAYDVNANLSVAFSPITKYETEAYTFPDGSTKQVIDFDTLTFDYRSLKPAGYGGAVDLGVTYEPVKNLVLSLAVLDLGGIGWKNNLSGKSGAGAGFEGKTYSLNSNDAQNAIEDEANQMLETLKALIKFEPEEAESTFRMLPTRINLGARYYMPFYDRLSVGVLGSYRFEKYTPYFDVRAGATITPVDWFSLTGSFGVNAYCMSYGTLCSFNLGPFNLIGGVEGYCGKVGQIKLEGANLTLPLDSFAAIVKFGLNITFGDRHTQFSNRTKGFKNLPKE